MTKHIDKQRRKSFLKLYVIKRILTFHVRRNKDEKHTFLKVVTHDYLLLLALIQWQQKGYFFPFLHMRSFNNLFTKKKNAKCPKLNCNFPRGLQMELLTRKFVNFSNIINLFMYFRKQIMKLFSRTKNKVLKEIGYHDSIRSLPVLNKLAA